MNGMIDMAKFNWRVIAAAMLICSCGVRCAAPTQLRGRPLSKPSLTEEQIEKYLGERWYGIYFKKQKIGYARSEISRERYNGEPAIVVAFTFHAQVKMLGVPQEMTITEKRTYVLGKGLAFFVSDTTAGDNVMKFTGRMKGRAMLVTSIVGGKLRSSTVEIPRERFEDYVAEERLVREGARVGDEISFSQYQPSLEKTITAVSRLKDVQRKIMRGVATETYVVETTLKEMGITSTLVMNADGEVLQSDVGGGFIMRLEDEKTAKNIDYRSDIILSTVIKPNRPIEDPSDVTEMRVRIRGVKDRALLVQSERQAYTLHPNGDALLVVRVEDLSDVPAPGLPMKKEEFPSELEPGIFVQSDAPEIIARARAIVGDERNALKANDKIIEWVYGSITKRFSGSFSNALDVLRSRSGDCTEHSVLYVALARAAGIPAREVSGIVYSGEDDGFYYHQWAEAFMGKWIAVDPTFCQSRADATHIKFVGGDLLSQARLLNLIGALKIEILEYIYD